jgi:hypothetical protein
MSDDESKAEDRFVVVIVVLAILAAAAMAVLFVIFTRSVAWPQQTNFPPLRMFVFHPWHENHFFLAALTDQSPQPAAARL